MNRFLSRTVSSILAGAALSLAQTGIHIQSRSLYNPIPFGTDSVLVQAGDHQKIFNRIAVIDLKTKAWAFVNDTDYNEYMGGTWVMKSRTEGVLSLPSPAKVFRTTDGWKSMVLVPDSVSPGYMTRIVTTSAGYLAQDANGNMVLSADGAKWSKVLVVPRGTYPWGSYGDRVYVQVGSYDRLSKDGGKTYVESEFKGTFGTKFVAVFGGDSLLFHNDTALVWTTDILKTSIRKKAPLRISKVWARDAREIWVSDATGKLSKTLDGGDTWSALPSIPAEMNSNTGLPDLAVGQRLFAWPFGQSTDGGQSWQFFLPTWGIAAGIWSIDFRGSRGMVGKSKGEILFTDDMGRTFSRRDSAGNLDIMAVKILSNGLMLAGDRNGQAFTSSDTGRTWVQKSTSTFPLNSIRFQTSSDEQTIILSRNGQPVVSVDGGKTFEFVQVAAGSACWTVKPNGTMIQAAGTIPTDLEISSFTSKGLRVPLDTLVGEVAMDMTTVDANLGFLLTYAGGKKETHVYRTTDGWASASLAGIVPAAIMGAGRLQVVGKDTLFVYVENLQAYYRSTDAGKTWSTVTLPLITKYPTSFKAIKRAWFHNGTDLLLSTASQEALWIDLGSRGSSLSVGDRPVRTSNSQIARARFDLRAGTIRLEAGKGIGDVRVLDLSGAVVENRPGHDLESPLEANGLPGGLYVLTIRHRTGAISSTHVFKP